MLDMVVTMRSEIIDKILTVEDQAQAIRDKAEEDARKIVLNSQEEAARIVKSALEEERKRGDEVVSQATLVLDSKLRDIEEKSSALAKTQVQVDAQAVETARDRIVRLICDVPLLGEGS